MARKKKAHRAAGSNRVLKFQRKIKRSTRFQQQRRRHTYYEYLKAELNCDGGLSADEYQRLHLDAAKRAGI